MNILVPFLLAFTVPAAPARHPTVITNGDYANPAVYVFDPYAPGASGGITNLSPLTVPCSPSQGIGISNDGGSIAVSCVDSSTQSDVVTPPAAPAGQSTTIYQFTIDAGFPAITSSVSGVWPTPIPVGYLSPFSMFSTTQSWAPVKCGFIPQWGNTSLGYIGENPSQGFSVTGTPQSVNWANTSLLTRMKSTYFATAGSINTTAAIKPQGVSMWRGNAANAGGFLVWIRGYLQLATATTRFAAGIFGTTVTLATASDPNTQTNSAYIGCNAADANLSVCSNDATSTATCATLGASFPCHTTGAFYDFWFSAAPNGGPINYYVERLDVAAVATGQFTTDLPATTVQLGPQLWMNTGGGANAIGLGFVAMCMAVNL